MVIVDILFFLIIFVLIIRSSIKGFIAEVFSIGAVIAGILIAITTNSFIAEKIFLWWGWPLPWNRISAFLILFLLTYLIFKVIESLIHKLFKLLHLGGFDRILGVFLGSIEGILLVFILVSVLTIQPFFDTVGIFKGSLFVNILVPIVVEYFTEFFPALDQMSF